MSPSLPPSMLKLIQPIIADNSALVSSALQQGLLDPSQLDPENLSHRAAICQALNSHPTLRIPKSLLTRMPSGVLWHHVSNSTLADELTNRLRARDKDAITGYFSTHFYATNLFSTPIQEAFTELAQQGVFDDSQLSALHKSRHFSPETKTALLRIIRSRAAKKAARTRAKPNAEVAPKPPKGDSLLKAIQQNDPDRLGRHTTLPTLSPERVQQLLPYWLKAPERIQAHLIVVPHLPDEARAAALEAWATVKHPTYAWQPIACQVIDRLSSQTTYLVLTRWIRGYATIEPIPNDAWLTNTLFRLSLDSPDDARRLRTALRLTHWRNTLTALADLVPYPEPPDDPTAQWVRLLSGHSTLGSAFDIAPDLIDQFEQWPPDYQRALAQSLLSFTDRALASL